MRISFFTTLQAGWLNAWIPSFGMVLIQFIYMAIFREEGKRAVDTSWYTAKDRMNASVSSLLQIALLVLSIFVPFKAGTAWFTIGAVIYLLSLAAFVWAFHSYVGTPADKTIHVKETFSAHENSSFYLLLRSFLQKKVLNMALLIEDDNERLFFATRTKWSTFVGAKKDCCQTNEG